MLVGCQHFVRSGIIDEYLDYCLPGWDGEYWGNNAIRIYNAGRFAFNGYESVSSSYYLAQRGFSLRCIAIE